MRVRRVVGRALARYAITACALSACAITACVSGPPPTHALVVRHLERKCALIAFSGCAALMAAPRPEHEEREELQEPLTEDLDAGAE
jgi:hypothetical protein